METNWRIYHDIKKSTRMGQFDRERFTPIRLVRII